MTFVLLVVLVWYTAISPSYAPSPLRAAGGDAPDAEGREAERVRVKGVKEISPARVEGTRGAASRAPADVAAESVDDLDWPEVIGGD